MVKQSLVINVTGHLLAMYSGQHIFLYDIMQDKPLQKLLAARFKPSYLRSVWSHSQTQLLLEINLMTTGPNEHQLAILSPLRTVQNRVRPLLECRRVPGQLLTCVWSRPEVPWAAGTGLGSEVPKPIVVPR